MGPCLSSVAMISTISPLELDVWDVTSDIVSCVPQPTAVTARVSGLYHLRQYIATDQLTQLDYAITEYKEANKLILGLNKRKLECLYNLGCAYFLRFEELEKRKDIDQTIYYLNKALDTASGDDSYYAQGLEALGLAYWTLYHSLDVHDHVDDACDCFERMVSLIQDDARKAEMLEDLSEKYDLLFEELGNQKYLEQLVACLQQAVSLTANSRPEISWRQYKLGTAYQLLGKQLGEGWIFEHHEDILHCISKNQNEALQLRLLP
ncbi:hypothetical protein FRC12_007915 [Ceratobasidium sp. 428]|nr:hypothetical protein FRC12_007915 [Ceratobasidium sp. 428]